MIYRRADSAFWWMCLSAPGKPPKRQSTKIPADALIPAQRAELKRQAEAVYLRAQAKYVLQASEPEPKPTIKAWKYLKWYAQHVSEHHKGKIREMSMIRRLIWDLGHHDLAALTPERILEWRTARAEEVSASSVNRELDVLKAALSRAVPTYLDRSPAYGIPRLKHQAPPMRILSREDEGKLLAVLAPADQAIVIAAIDTLIRAGDLLRLTWEDDHGAYLTVRDPKTSRPYQVPISSRLRQALDALPRSGPYVFGHRRPQNGRSIELYRMIQDACEQAGLAVGRGVGVTFHGLRHTGASRLVAAGVDLRTVQELGGWRTLQQLSRYAHPTQQRLREAVEAIGEGVPGFTSDSRPQADPQKQEEI